MRYFPVVGHGMGVIINIHIDICSARPTSGENEIDTNTCSDAREGSGVVYPYIHSE